MNKITYTLLILTTLSLGGCAGKSGENKNTISADMNNDLVTVYYFHGEHRCPTCIAIENETRAAFELNLKDEAESGKVELQVLNADEGRNRQICEKYSVYGSTLLVVKGNKNVNLTNMAFSVIHSSSDKFREELAKEVKKLINN